MPFVEIALPAAHPASQRRALADAVHRALTETVDVPPDDRFQLLRAYAPEDISYDAGYLGVQRSPDFTLIRVTLRRGRSAAKKQALYRAIADNVQAATGLAPADLLIVLSENDALDWSFGDGVAQYAHTARASSNATPPSAAGEPDQEDADVA